MPSRLRHTFPPTSMNFLPTLPVFAAYLAAVLIITFTPGPDMTLFLGVVLVVVAMVFTVPMIVFASRLAETLKRTPRIMRAIDWLFAGIFSAFAVRLLFTRNH